MTGGGAGVLCWALLGWLGVGLLAGAELVGRAVDGGAVLAPELGPVGAGAVVCSGAGAADVAVELASSGGQWTLISTA